MVAHGQYKPGANFKADFKQHMLTPTEKEPLTFYQRDIIHTNVAGGALATVGIPVLTAGIIGLNGENQQMAITGVIFGGLATLGSMALHTIGIEKLLRYEKKGYLKPATVSK